MSALEAVAALAVILGACLIASVWVNVAYSQQVTKAISDRDTFANDWWDAVIRAQDAESDLHHAHKLAQEALTDAGVAREALDHERAAHRLTAAELTGGAA